MGIELRLDNARLSMAKGLWEASAYEEGGTKKFYCDLILMPDTKVLELDAAGNVIATTTIAAAQAKVATEAFKGDKAKAKAWFDDLESKQKSVRDGNKKKDKAGNIRDGYEGLTYVAAKNKTRPSTYDGNVKPVTEADGVIYSGCRVNARIGLYANTDPKIKGVFVSLGGVQFAGEGDSFGGARVAAAGEFEPATEGANAGDFA